MRLFTPQAANRPFELGSMFRFSWKRDLQHDRKRTKTAEVQKPELVSASWQHNTSNPDILFLSQP